MKKAFNFQGLVSTKREIHGIEVRPLNFNDISAVWQAKGEAMIAAWDNIVKSGDSVTQGDIVTVVSDIIKFAPDLAHDAFIAAIDDDGEPRVIGIDAETGVEVSATASEVWKNYMGLGKQFEILYAIFDLTVQESDVLKKRVAKMKAAMRTNSNSTTAQVMSAMRT